MNIYTNLHKKTKNENGFTMADLAVALIAFGIFVGVISALFINVYNIKAQTMLNADAMYYLIKVIEDVDRISFAEVDNGMEQSYKQKFGIPDSMNLVIEVSDSGNANAKKVQFSIEYTFRDHSERIVINRLKMKEA